MVFGQCFSPRETEFLQLFHRDHIRTACLSVYHSLPLWFLLKTQSKLKPKLYPYLTILSTCQLFSLSLSAVNTSALAVEMYLHCNSIVFLIFFSFYFFNYFNMLILKNKKNIILKHFLVKNTLKNNFYHTLKHTFTRLVADTMRDQIIFQCKKNT
jgi:hypothetical protein